MKHSTEALALVKYVSLIRDLADRGHNWQFYDENFRFLRQSHVASMPWGAIHNELWLRSHFAPNTRVSLPTRSGPQRVKTDGTPPGYCFRFHSGNKCQVNCRYKHSYFRCKGEHKAKDCNFRAPRSNNTDKSPLSAKSVPQGRPSTSNSSATR